MSPRSQAPGVRFNPTLVRLRPFARRGTALADYLAVPTPEGWEQLRAEAEASRKALGSLEEALR